METSEPSVPPQQKPLARSKPPAARGSELNGRSLYRLMVYAAAGRGHGAEFVCHLHLHSDATNVARKITNRFTGLTGFLIDVNQQRGVASVIDSNRGAQDFRLPHPIRGDVLLNCHDSLDVCVRAIKYAGGRSRERSEGNKSGEDSGRQCC